MATQPDRSSLDENGDRSPSTRTLWRTGGVPVSSTVPPTESLHSLRRSVNHISGLSNYALGDITSSQSLSGERPSLTRVSSKIGIPLTTWSRDVPLEWIVYAGQVVLVGNQTTGEDPGVGPMWTNLPSETKGPLGVISKTRPSGKNSPSLEVELGIPVRGRT